MNQVFSCYKLMVKVRHVEHKRQSFLDGIVTWNLEGENY